MAPAAAAAAAAPSPPPPPASVAPTTSTATKTPPTTCEAAPATTTATPAVAAWKELKSRAARKSAAAAKRAQSSSSSSLSTTVTSLSARARAHSTSPTTPALVTLSQAFPSLFLADGLLDAAACAALVREEARGLLPSTVSAGPGASRFDKSFRDSSSLLLRSDASPLVARAVKAMKKFADEAAATAGRCGGAAKGGIDGGGGGEEEGEEEEGALALLDGRASIVRYEVGEKFVPHWDHGSKTTCNRTLTVLLYLNGGGKKGDGLVGGGTLFLRAGKGAGGRPLPDGVKRCAESGSLRVLPRPGRAVAFFNTTREGDRDDASEHAGEKVVAGKKYLLTAFFLAANC
jgi:hypothetical protein